MLHLNRQKPSPLSDSKTAFVTKHAVSGLHGIFAQIENIPAEQDAITAFLCEEIA